MKTRTAPNRGIHLIGLILSLIVCPVRIAAAQQSLELPPSSSQAPPPPIHLRRQTTLSPTPNSESVSPVPPAPQSTVAPEPPPPPSFAHQSEPPLPAVFR